ncbi:MAG: type IV secretion system DNA-binding domain-containing protein [Candidatus Pacebacteria bacterium]|nr:type IV secretion system DNA-binding domain-containing protein [Candidatus Paceibacterota bacterium]
MEDPNQITYFAETDFRNKKTKFGIKADDRTRHIYVIGKTGMGKSTMIENMAAQDIQNGNGVCFIDPHGSAVDTLLDYVPENRIDDVVYFSPADTKFPVAFNVMEDIGPERRYLVAQGLLSAFKKIWGEESFSDRMEHITSNTLLALLEYPGSTMLSIPRMFVDKIFQKKVVANITDPIVKAFWEQEYASWDDRYRKEAYSAVLNKVGQFTSNPIIRNIVGQPKSSFDFRDILDNKKILLVNLSIGQIGESNADLLGSMMTTKIYLSAMSRSDLAKEDIRKLPPFYLYIDEFQNLANDSFADILSQARKYKLALTMAHQYVEQMPDTVKAAVFGNVGSMIVFRIGPTDAELLEREFSPTFTADDIVNLGFTQIYLRLMINGVGSTPFSATTLPPLQKPNISFRNEVIEASRKTFSKDKESVEKAILEDLESSNPKKEDKKSEKKIERNINEAPKKVAHNENERKENFQREKPRDMSRKNYQERPRSPQPPVLEGKNSLKEALESLKSENKEISFKKEKGFDVKKKGASINEDIQTENKNKLRQALSGVMEDVENEKEEISAENKPKEVPENVLRGIFEEGDKK